MPRAKPKRTHARNVFDANLERSRAFLRIFDKGRGPGQPTNDEKELLRGSLVFAVGALDAYLSDLIVEVVPQYSPASSELAAALKAIAKADPGLSLRVALAPTKADATEEFRSALDDWLSTKSFQGPEKVVEALAYVGCAISWDSFDHATGISPAAEHLRKITGERNGIVHEGKKPYVRRHLAEEANNFIGAMAKHIDTRCAPST